jgi:hypothetical protein
MSKFGGIPLDGGSRFGGIPLEQSQPIDDDVPRLDAQGNLIDTYQPPEKPAIADQSLPENAASTGIQIIASLASQVPTQAEYLKESVQNALRSLVDEGYTPLQAAQEAQKEASKYAFQPSAPGAMSLLNTIDEVTGQLPAVMGGAPSVPRYNAPVRAIGQEVGQDVRRSMTPRPQPMNAVGAAEVDKARQRQELANELPVPIKLTQGQATQDMQQQKFERETAKLEEGEELRKNANLQNEQFNQNLDAMIDQTGTTLPDDALVETGLAITKALENQVKAEKLKINRAYDAADKSKGAQEAVNLDIVGGFINDNMPSANYSGNILDAFQKETKRLGLSDGDMNNGDYQIGDMTVYQAEQLRKFVNANIDSTNPKDKGIGYNLKKAIDESVGDAGGEPYKRARRLRTKYGEKYQEKKLINDLVSTKPNSSDRKIALENVFQKSVKTGSAEELKNLRRTLQRTDEGRQAFSELTAQAIKNIKKQATGNIGQDENGNPLVSPAKLNKEIKALDESGKLDILFGKKGAEDLRTIAEVAKDVFVSQPGAVNYSNTSSALMTMIDAAMLPASFAATGLPMTGIATGAKAIKDRSRKRRTKKQIKEALEFDTGANQ